MTQDLVGESGWDDRYQSLELAVADDSDPVLQWLRPFLADRTGSCLELGCFPGRYLAAIGGSGFEVHGIDRTPRTETDLRQWLSNQDLRVGEIVRADVFDHQFRRKYDLVCSFGLIEHFSDWPELVRIHADLVADGGLLILTTPNFRGTVQRALHAWLDGDNLREHNLDAMDPSAWRHIVEPLGFNSLQCGWFGRFDFWAGPLAKRGLHQRVGRRLMRSIRRAGRFFPEGVREWAPYCGMVAQKNATGR